MLQVSKTRVASPMKVMDGMLLLGYEARNGGDNRWMGFGFSEPGATDVLMPGSDAVVGGWAGQGAAFISLFSVVRVGGARGLCKRHDMCRFMALVQRQGVESRAPCVHEGARAASNILT